MAVDEYAEYRGNDHNLKRVLTDLAEELDFAQKEVDNKKSELEDAQAHLKELSHRTIPEAADGLDGKFELEGTERQLIIEEIIRASIAEERKEPAIKWLDENGYGNLVKRQLIIEFNRDDEERYKSFVEHIKMFPGPNLVIKRTDSVHHATLTSWVREKLEAGVDLPVQIFGIFRGRVAKLK